MKAVKGVKVQSICRPGETLIWEIELGLEYEGKEEYATGLLLRLHKGKQLYKRPTVPTGECRPSGSSRTQILGAEIQGAREGGDSR